MFRTLLFVGLAGAAAVGGRQLYRNGTLGRLGGQLKDGADQLKRHWDDRTQEGRAAHEAAGGPGGGPIMPLLRRPIA
jgi:hypothetical protein